MLSFRKMVAQSAPDGVHGLLVQRILTGNTANSVRPKKLSQDHTWYLFLPQPREIIASSGCTVLMPAEKRDVHIRPQSHVVGQVPAYIVGVLIDDYAIAIPVPVVAVAIVVLGHVEVKAVEPEAVRPAAGQHKHVAGAKAAVVVSVLPGMIVVVMNIVAPAFVADPSAVIAVDMGRIGMPFAVAKAALVAVTMLVTAMMLVTIAMVIVAVPLRPVLRNVLVVAVMIVIAVPVMIVMILRHGIKAKSKDYDKKSEESLHRQPSL